MGISLGGLVTNMNTDDMIQKLLQIDQFKIDQQTKQKTDLKDKQDGWATVRTTLTALRSKLDGVRFSSGFQQRTVTTTVSGVADVVAQAGATATSHTLTVDQLATAQRLTGNSSQTDATVALGLTAGKITLNGKLITIDGTESLYGLADKINTSGAGVSADVEQVMDVANNVYYRLTMTAQKTGEANAITMSDDQGGAILEHAKLGLKAAGVWAGELVTAKDAIFHLDTTSRYQKSDNVVTDVLPNLTITLRQESATTVFTVSRDISKTTQAVQDFVDQYNTTVQTLKDLTLTDVANQKYGQLSGDATARQLLSSMQSFMGRSVDLLPDSMNQLSQAGIASGKWGTTDYGKVVVDTKVLTAALQSDPDAVARVFGALTGPNTSGVIKDLYNYVNGSMAYQIGMVSARDQGLTDQISEIDKRVLDMQSKMKDHEDQLRAQFARLESSIQKLNTQGGAFIAQMQAIMGTSSSSSSSSK